MAKLKLPKGEPRVSPRTPREVNSRVLAEYEKTVRTWGIPNNLIRTMAAMPQLALTEVDYANAFIFDVDQFTSWPKPGSPEESVAFPCSGFVDRSTKELVINLVSLLNRSRYSITHHTFIGFVTLSAASSSKQAEQMLLQLVNDKGEPTYAAARGLYSSFQVAALKLAEQIQAGTGHDVDDKQTANLKKEMRSVAVARIAAENKRREKAQALPTDSHYVEAYVEGMLVELTWCICHFGGLLNKWFTVLRVRDEEYPVAGGKSFVENYNAVVPERIRVRNNALLGKDGWGGN